MLESGPFQHGRKKSRFRVGIHLFECTIFGKNHIDKNVHMHLETRDKDLLGLYKIGPFMIMPSICWVANLHCKSPIVYLQECR